MGAHCSNNADVKFIWQHLAIIHTFLFLPVMKLPSRTPETTKMILLSRPIKSVQVSQYKAEMAACKPPMESNFAFFKSKSNGLSSLLFFNNSSPTGFSRGKTLRTV